MLIWEEAHTSPVFFPPPSLPLWLGLELVDENSFSNPINCYEHLKGIFTTEPLTLTKGSHYQVVTACSGFFRARPILSQAQASSVLRWTRAIPFCFLTFFLPLFKVCPALGHFSL